MSLKVWLRVPNVSAAFSIFAANLAETQEE